MEKTIRLYESTNIAQSYSKFRPTLPEQLLQEIFTFSARQGIGDQMAVDLACGPGQSTFPLCGRFRRTVGVDISKAQIACALEKKKALGVSDDVEFLVTSASDLPFEDESVDLITCGVAWHWLDPDTVFVEIDRVLRRPGVLAIYCHSHTKLHHEKCEKLYSDFYHGCIWQDGPYGNVKDVCCESRYRDVKLPYPLAERHDVEHEATMSLEDLEGFVRSLDCYEEYCRQNPGNTTLEDMLVEMNKQLQASTGEEDENYNKMQPSSTKFRVNTPFYLLLAVKN